MSEIKSHSEFRLQFLGILYNLSDNLVSIIKEEQDNDTVLNFNEKYINFKRPEKSSFHFKLISHGGKKRTNDRKFIFYLHMTMHLERHKQQQYNM